MLRRSLRAAALGTVALLPALALAQGPFDDRLGPATASGEPRFMGGLGGAFGQPVHEFRDYVRQGFGVNGHALYRVGGQGALALRADLGFLNYGNETKRIPWSDYAGRVSVDLHTSNNIFWGGIGPQLMVPSGPIRPYASGTVGFTVFSTTSSIKDRQTNEDIVSDNNMSDGGFAYTGAGGILVPLSIKPRSTVFLDIGARYHNNGRVTYLRKGGITDLPGGQVRYDEIRSQANLWTYQIGVSVGGR